mgnify:CR=1 FL=1
MRVAVIDLGTNTFNLLVRDTQDHEEVHAMKLPVKLGQGGLLDRRISPQAMQRGLEALGRYRRIIDSLEVDAIYAFGTSALRDALNREEFLGQVLQKFGFRVSVISGQEEAELILEGVKYGIDLSHGNYLIMDIGGGSTEFILTRDGRQDWSRSFQIGSSRLRDRFPVSDPISDQESDEIKDFLDQELDELWQTTENQPVRQLIGSSGSFETLAQVTLSRRGHPHESPANGFCIPRNEYQAITRYFAESNLQERLDDPAILDMRADMIGLAAILLRMVTDKLNIDSIVLSNFALKEGVFSKLLANNLTWQRS